MTNEKLLYAAYQNVLFDELGNRRHAHMIARYYKDCSGQWQEQEWYTTDAGSTFVIDGKIYFLCNDHLIPMNMDFDSPTCGACEKIIGEVHILYAVTKNEYHAHGSASFVRLHKQSYSDGTVFYSLQDGYGDFFPHHGNRDPHALAAVLRQDADQKKGRFPQSADDLLRFASLLESEPAPMPDPRNNEVTLSYLTDGNPLGVSEIKSFPNLQDAVTWAKRNVPKASAGWSVYSTINSSKPSLTLYDYRRTV